MIKEFKEFILRGNVVDLAVGVVIGSAFTAIVKDVVDGVITPLIGAVIYGITGGGSIEDTTNSLNVTLWNQEFQFGAVVTAIITFLITGLVLFLVVKAINKARDMKKQPEETVEAAPTAEDYLKEIRDLLASEQTSVDKEDMQSKM